MFDVRDLSNAAIVLLVIIAYASVFTVYTLATSPSVPAPLQDAERTFHQVPVDPNISFDLLPSTAKVAVGDTFSVMVVVRNAANMFGWQIYVRYDPAVVECLGAVFPTGYVYSGSITVSGALASFDPTQFNGSPIQKVCNDEGWVGAGDCLLGLTQPTFDGSGYLCQLDFKAVSQGSTVLALLHEPGSLIQTYTMNPEISLTTSSSPSYATVNVVPP